ncbi:MAG: hypothetical protein A2992_02935 [Elusimicrobia bacterium RIFCSPLOWO2_01_FULL_59_12]|nr:MAG: hypothetical protein A2992_02935 [Elusimicrobia bacterium RIFCSPLOWO2_01_FULL_59_12]
MAFDNLCRMSAFTIKKFSMWSVEIDDVVGATTGLFKVLADAGADIEFSLCRPLGEKPGKAILFLAPIKGKKQEDAAKRADFVMRPDVVGVQVQGPSRVGGNFRLTAALEHANLSVRALVTTVDGDRFTTIFALKSDTDAELAMKVLRQVVD